MTPRSQTPWDRDEAARIASALRHLDGPLLPILHALQKEFGYIPEDAHSIVADVLNLSRAEVHGVVTFYGDFRSNPPGASTIRICQAEACQALGAEKLGTRAKEVLDVEFGCTTADSTVTLEKVYCLGNCALGPSVMIDGTVFGRVDCSRFDELLTKVKNPQSALRERPAVRTGSAQAVTIYVPGDTAARSVGSDDVATVITELAGESVNVIRTGSRGLLWLEPLVEVSTPRGRIGYGPVRAEDVPSLLRGDLLHGGDHPLCLGPVESIPWIARQRRVTFSGVGIVDPHSAADYEAHGGLSGLRRGLEMAPEQIIEMVSASGLRGRGGAGFPTGIKWNTVKHAPGDSKYICCNADEGDSGTFADRMLLEGDPFLLIEGMTICALAVGASKGFIYIRSEYPAAVETFRAAVDTARSAGWLGPSVLGSPRRFDIDVRVGAGSYICGEETAMLESLEGRRGVVRAKPPLPALQGLFGKPTVINNVLTLAAVPYIIAEGPDAYAKLGSERSRGTQIFQLGGNIARGGIFELPFGVTLAEMIDEIGGGAQSGRPVKAAQVGGPLGAYLPIAHFGTPLEYEAFAAKGAMIGHGGIVVFDETVDMGRQARFAMEFCAEESCGKCTPCRIGSVRGTEVIDRILTGEATDQNLALLEDLCEVMASGSMCAMGGLTPMPVRSALEHFPEDFRAPTPSPAHLPAEVAETVRVVPAGRR